MIRARKKLEGFNNRGKRTMKLIKSDNGAVVYLEAEDLAEGNLLKGFMATSAARECHLRIEKGVVRLYAEHFLGNINLIELNTHYEMYPNDKETRAFIMDVMQHGGEIVGTLHQDGETCEPFIKFTKRNPKTRKQEE